MAEPLPLESNRQAPTSPTRRSIPGWVRWVLGVVLGPPLALVVAWFALDGWAMRRLAQARGAFGQHGDPMTLEELLPRPVTRDENAAPLLDAAWLHIASENADANPESIGRFASIIDLPSSDSIHEGVWRWTDNEVATIRDHAADTEFRETCALVREAARRPRFVADVDYREGYSVQLPHVYRMRVLAHMAIACAVVDSEDGEMRERAWENALAALSLANDLGQGPTLIESLAAVVVGKHAIETLASLLEKRPSASDVARALPLVVARLESHGSAFVRACHAERLMVVVPLEQKAFEDGADWIDLIERLAERPMDPAPPRSLRPLIIRVTRPYLAWDFSRTYEAFSSACAITTQSGAAARAAWDQFDERRESPRGLLSPVLVPALHRIDTSYRCHETMLKLLRVAMESFQFSERTGTWPLRIEELNLDPLLTVDRCSGHPIVLEVNGSQLLVYAFGMDGDDDGAKPSEHGSSANADGDIVLRLNLANLAP